VGQRPQQIEPRWFELASIRADAVYGLAADYSSDTELSQGGMEMLLLWARRPELQRVLARLWYPEQDDITCVH
jgi:hypothetical protein